jgi:hypothetical protein
MESPPLEKTPAISEQQVLNAQLTELAAATGVTFLVWDKNDTIIFRAGNATGTHK